MRYEEHGWLVPDWPVHASVKAVFSLRHCPLLEGLPLGQRPIFLHQVHGNAVLELTHDTPTGCQADASITAEFGIACTVRVADCLPVLFASSDGRVVAAAHAGWRGLAGGVLENTAQKMLEIHKKADFQASFSAPGQQIRARAAIKIIAWLGPCIGPQRFEVGAEVRDAFMQTMPDAAGCFVASQEKFHADLAALARQRLQALGITEVYGNDSSPGWCTASHPNLYFSYRRDAVNPGRMAACVWRDGGASG